MLPTPRLFAIVGIATVTLLSACGGDDGDTATTAPDISVDLPSGSGTAEVTVGETTYTVATTDVCAVIGDEYELQGLGEGSDGTQGWVRIAATRLTRAELEEIFDADEVDAILDGAESVLAYGVNVEVGRTSFAGEAGVSQPIFHASNASGSDASDSLEMTIDGKAASGSGEAVDENGVAFPYGETRPIEFTAACD